MEGKSGEEICLFVRDEQTGRPRSPRKICCGKSIATPTPTVTVIADFASLPRLAGFVDYAGTTLEVIDPDTGEVRAP